MLSPKGALGFRISPWMHLAMVISIGLLFSTASLAQEDTVRTLSITDRSPVAGVPPISESFIVSSPPAAPTAVLIMLPGLNGVIQLTPVGLNDGTLDVNSDNFVTRARWLFASQGFYVVELDAATDFQLSPQGLNNQQGNTAHIQDILQVIAWARSTQPGVPVWLLGHSRGTAGAFVAAAYNPAAGGPDGLVFMAPNNDSAATDPDSVLAADLGTITVPTLRISNLLDTCAATLPTADATVRKELMGSRSAALLYVKGGFPPLTDDCHALSHHGFFGIEPQSVTVVANWINAEDKLPFTSTVVTTSGSPSPSGTAVTFIATISSIFPVPDGETITFFDGSAQIGTGTTSSGAATFTTSALSVGSHTIRGVYTGDGTFRKSSGWVRQVVTH